MQARLAAGAALTGIWRETSLEAQSQSAHNTTLEAAVMILADSGWSHGIELRNIYYGM